MIALAALFLGGCEIGSQTAPKTIFRAPSGGSRGATAQSNSAEVGTSITVAVTVKDKSGYGIGGMVPSITAVGQASGSSNGVSSGGCTTSDLNGLSSCTLSATNADVYTIQLVAPVAQTTTSKVTFFQLPRSLSFSVSPATPTVAANVFATQPVVQVIDRVGNLVAANAALPVTVSLTAPGSATLSGTASKSVVAGIADFTGLGLKVDISGTYTLTAALLDANVGTVTGVSAPFVISAGAVHQLAFTTSPSDTATNVPFSPAPVVAIQDAGGNTVTTSNCVVTVSLSGGAAGDALLGTLSVTAASGVADFSKANLRISTTAAENVQLQATSACAGLAAGPFLSAHFNMTLAGTPAQLAVTTAPGPASLNQVWPTQPIVQVLDSSGNLVSSDNSTVVTLSKIAPSPAGTIVGSTSILVTNGVANFSGLQTSGAVGNDGSYTLQFTGTDAPFVITPVTVSQQINAHGLTPSQLAFKTPPGNVAINQQEATIVVQTEDSSGFFCFDDNTSQVQLQLFSGPAGATMSQNGAGAVGVGGVIGSTTAVNGLASFPGISFSKAGNYVLKATSVAAPILLAGQSNTFAIAAFTTGNQLAFTQEPASNGTAAGTPWSTQPKVAVEDVDGNVVTSDNTTVISLTCTSPSTCGGLLGTTSATVVNGIADFTGHGLRTNQTAAPLANVVVHATSSPAFIPTDSANFTENGGLDPAVSLVFTAQPADAGPFTGEPWTTQPIVSLLDINGAVVASDSSSIVTLQCASPLGCGLNGAVSMKVVNGVANFSAAGLFVNRDHSAATCEAITIRATASSTGSSFVFSNSFCGN